MNMIRKNNNSMRRAALRAGLCLALACFLVAACDGPNSNAAGGSHQSLIVKKAPDAKKKDCSDWSKDLPPACHSSEDCIKSHGHGWFCSDQNRITDACGEEHVWPQCKPIR